MKNDFMVLRGAAEEVARRLLGCVLESEYKDRKFRVRIVETEAYDQTDVASHSYRGETERTKVMFGPAGHLYVYFTYGLHYCANITVGDKGYGAAVLLRAVEPLGEAQELLMDRRRGKTGIELTNGPAKLCQALGIDMEMSGHNLRRLPLKLVIEPRLTDAKIVRTTRVGISQGQDVPWRFYIKDNPYVSVKMKSE